MGTRRYSTAVAAIASAAIIVSATQADVPLGHQQVVAQAPALARVSSAQYELTALTDITLVGITGAFVNGWGGYVSDGSVVPVDPYWNDFPADPVNAASLPIKQYGVLGVAYYVTSKALDDNPAVNYFFEVSPDAAAFVALMQATGGPSTLAGAVIRYAYSIPALFGQIVVAATADIPVVGGITSAYYNGYGTLSKGIPSVIRYLGDTVVHYLQTGALASPAVVKAAVPGSARATAIRTTGTGTTGSAAAPKSVKALSKVAAADTETAAVSGKSAAKSKTGPAKKTTATAGKGSSDAGVRHRGSAAPAK